MPASNGKNKNMPNINLATENVAKKESKPIDKSLTLSILALVLLAIIYIGLIAANRGVSSKIKATQDGYSAEYNKFLAGGSDQILDFKDRGDVAKEMLSKNKPMSDILNQIESSTLPAVYLNSLKYDKNKKTVSIEGLGDNFQVVAEQILSFKQNEYFSAVIPGRSFIDSINNNKINFSVDLIIK